MKRITYIIIIFSSVFFVGCKKFLNQEPYNNLSIEDVFKDFEGARTTLAGCYDKLNSSNYYLRTFSIYPEVTAGNIKYSRPSNQALGLSYNFLNSFTDNDMVNFYKNAYALIYNTNTIIANVNKITDANALQKNRLMADAYSIRALSHFDLVRVFGQAYNFTTDASHPAIVIRNKLVDILTPVGSPNTCKELYNQITNDLDSAILLYGNSVKIFTVGDDKTYFSVDAAKALQSRVALYKEDWNKVVTLTNEVISSNRYTLITNAGYVNSWRQKNISTESIFEIAFGIRNAGSLGDFYNPTNNANGQLAATTDLLNLFSVGDVRAKPSMFKDSILNATLYSFPKKYFGINDTANNIKIIRLSELYLNRAEANAELNNLTAALADLNIIRKRANPASINFVSTDKQIILNEILVERRRELCFEAHTFFDLSRRKKDIVRLDCSGSNCSFTYPNNNYACIIPSTN
jgi:starch-binding outer membrane protein, SusD/RagB family